MWLLALATSDAQKNPLPAGSVQPRDHKFPKSYASLAQLAVGVQRRDSAGTSGVQLKLVMAAPSSEWTSKTVYSFVICRRSWIFLVRCSSFNSPPLFFTAV